MFKIKVTHISSDRATLTGEDGQIIRLPLSSFDGSPRLDSEVVLRAVVVGGADAGQSQLARDLLNELLKE